MRTDRNDFDEITHLSVNHILYFQTTFNKKQLNSDN